MAWISSRRLVIKLNCWESWRPRILLKYYHSAGTNVFRINNHHLPKESVKLNVTVKDVIQQSLQNCIQLHFLSLQLENLKLSSNILNWTAYDVNIATQEIQICSITRVLMDVDVVHATVMQHCINTGRSIISSRRSTEHAGGTY